VTLTPSGPFAARLNVRQVLAKVNLIEDGSPALGRYARDMVAKAVASGILTEG
jgi:hypothetical protein